MIFIWQAAPTQKLPALYLIDSIIKNVRDSNYKAIFAQQIVSIFVGVFEKVDEKTRQSMWKLRQTWADIFPNKKLYSLDMTIAKIDPAWPITAQPEAPAAKIHVNPRFLKKQQEEEAKLLEMQRQEELKRQKELKRQQEEELAMREAEELNRQREEELAKRMEEFNQQREQAIRIQKEQEQLVQQQLLTKQQELLKLKQQQLEIELQIKKQQIREQEVRQQAYLSQQIESAQEQLKKQQAQIEQPVVTADPAKRDPRLRDPRLGTRDPRSGVGSATQTAVVTPQLQPQRPAEKQSKQVAPPVENQQHAATSAQATDSAKAEPKPKKSDTSKSSESAPPRPASKNNVNDKRASSERKTAATDKKPEPKINTERKISTDTKDDKRDKERRDREIERETRRHSTRVADRRRNSRGSSPTRTGTSDRKRKSFESRSRSRSPRRSRSRSPRRSPRRKSAPEEKHPKRSRRGRRDEERTVEKAADSKTVDTEGAASRLRKRGTPPRKSPDKKESEGKAIVKYKSLVPDDPPKKKPKQDETPNPDLNSSDNKLSDEFAELFGKEDMDYRQMPPGDMRLSVDSDMQPVDQSADTVSPTAENLPREEGWAQFKASKPEKFPFKQPRRTSLPEAIYDTDLRLRAPPMSPAVSQQQGNKPEWPYSVSHAQRDIDIPTPLLLDKAENVLEQANYQLRSGKLTHSQHQELLKQLSELYRLQKLKQKLHKFELGEDQEIPMKMEDLDQFLRRGYKIPTRSSDSFEEEPSKSNDACSPLASPTTEFKPPEPAEPHSQKSPKALPFGQESEPTCDNLSDSFRGKDKTDPSEQHATKSGSPNRSRESDEGRRDYADGRPLRPLDNRDQADQFRPPPSRLRGPRDGFFKPRDFPTDDSDSQFYFPTRDMRWYIKNMRSSKRDTTCLAVVDNKRFELRHQVDKNVRVDGRMVAIRSDITLRHLYFNGELVYRFGEPPRQLQWNGKQHSVYFQGPSRNIWIDGQHLQICLDAPPASINIGGKEHEISVNCATCQVVVDGRPVCAYGGDTCLVQLVSHSFEISFQPLPRRILVDQQDRELDLTGDYPAIIIDGRRHGIQFKGPAREVLINRQPYLILPEIPRKIPIFGRRLYHVALGGPAHEIIIDDQWYEVKFGGPEKLINLGDKTVRIQLPDGPPGVKILGEMITVENIPRRLPRPLVRKFLDEIQVGGRLDARNAPTNGTNEDYTGYRPIDGVHSKDQDLRKPPGVPREWQPPTTKGIPKLLELDVSRPVRTGPRLADEDIRPRLHPDVAPADTLPMPPRFDHPAGEASNMEPGRNVVAPRIDGRFSREDPRRRGYYRDLPLRPGYDHQLPLGAEPPHDVRGLDPAQNIRGFGEPVPRESFETRPDQAVEGLRPDSQALPDGRLHGTDHSIAPMAAPPLPPTAISLPPGGVGVNPTAAQAFQMAQPSLSQGNPMSNSQLMGVASSQSSVMTTAGYSMAMPMPPLPPGLGMQLPGYSSQNPAGGMFVNPSPALPFGQMSGPAPAPTINTQIDVNSLFSQLVASGIISKDQPQKKDEAPKEEKTQKVEIAKPEEKAPAEIVIDKIPDLTKFDSDKLKKSYKGVIQALYSGIQCSSCGMRFVAEDTDNYREHLDWHFRQNKREKDGVKVAKFRRWYYEISDWIQYEELGDLEERAQSQFFETMLASVHQQLNQTYNQQAPAALVSCPAAGENESDDTCAICGEQFEQFWDEEEEEWHLRDAIRADGKTYHPVCYEDLKENSVLETPSSASVADTDPLTAVSAETAQPAAHTDSAECAQPAPHIDTSAQPPALPDPILNPIAYLTQIMAPGRADSKSVSPVAKVQETTTESSNFTGIPALSAKSISPVAKVQEPVTENRVFTGIPALSGKAESPVAKLQESTTESPSFTGIPALSIDRQVEPVQVKQEPNTGHQSESAVVKTEPKTKVLANCEAAGTVSVGPPVVKSEVIIKEEVTDANDNTNTSQNS